MVSTVTDSRGFGAGADDGARDSVRAERGSAPPRYTRRTVQRVQPSVAEACERGSSANRASGGGGASSSRTSKPVGTCPAGTDAALRRSSFFSAPSGVPSGTSRQAQSATRGARGPALSASSPGQHSPQSFGTAALSRRMCPSASKHSTKPRAHSDPESV